MRKAREAVASACRFAEKSENPALISEAIGYAGLVAAMCGRASEASDLVERALRIALDQELPEQTALAYRRRANVCEYGADYIGEAAAHLEAIRYCRTAGEKAGELSCLSCLAGAYFRTGEWKDASQTADAVLRDRKAHPAYRAIARTVRAQLAAFRGEQRSAARLLDRNLIELRQLGLAGIDFQVLWARAFYFENEGQSRTRRGRPMTKSACFGAKVRIAISPSLAFSSRRRFMRTTIVRAIPLTALIF